MSAAKIIRFPGNQQQRRAGRKSAREAYRRPTPQRGGRRTSARATQERGGPSSQPARAPGRSADTGRAPKVAKDRAGMATDYAIRLAPYQIARIRLESLGSDHSWIDWVYVPPGFRGRGIAAQLLRRVLRDADAHGVRLSLEPRSCGAVDQKALEAWYRKFGFHDTGRRGDFGWILARRPASASTTTARRPARAAA